MGCHLDRTTTNVVVIVNDTNDNKPIFSQLQLSSLEINEAEAMEINNFQLLLFRFTTDVDCVLSGTVVYEDSDSDCTSFFAVDSRSKVSSIFSTTFFCLE